MLYTDHEPLLQHSRQVVRGFFFNQGNPELCKLIDKVNESFRILLLHVTGDLTHAGLRKRGNLQVQIIEKPKVIGFKFDSI